MQEQEQKEKVDLDRRSFLISLASIFSIIGVAGIAWPFIKSLFPSIVSMAAGGPIRVDLSTLAIGEQHTVIWRNKPIWVIKRSNEMIKDLSSISNKLRDPLSKIPQQPKYAANINRSIRPDILVLVAACTHLGCAPTYRPDKNSIEKGWPGGFFCSCHGSKFDLAGRVYKGVPAPTNLEVPPYHFIDKETLIIGEDN